MTHVNRITIVVLPVIVHYSVHNNIETKEEESIIVIRFSMNNKLHRKNGPAVLFSNGVNQWWKNGRKWQK